MIYMLIGMWLSILVVPFIAWDVFSEREAFRSALPVNRLIFMDGVVDLLMCTGFGICAILFHRRHPKFLPLTVALLTASLAQRLLGYWLLPPPFRFGLAAPPWLPFVRGLGVLLYLLVIVYALRSRTLRKRLAPGDVPAGR